MKTYRINDYESLETVNTRKLVGVVGRCENHFTSGYNFVLDLKRAEHTITKGTLQTGLLFSPDDEGKVFVITIEEKKNERKTIKRKKD